MNYSDLALTVKQEGNLLWLKNNFDSAANPDLSTVILVEGDTNWFFVYTEEEDEKFFNLGNEASVRVSSFDIKKWESGLGINQPCTYDGKVWQRIALDYNLPPSDTNTDYREITDITELQNMPAYSQQTYLYYIPSLSASDSGVSIEKTGDHSFKLTTLNPYNGYIVRDYQGNEIESATESSDTLELVLSEDGLYTVEFSFDDTTIVAEVYDLTDTEKCYLKLLLDVACNCEDCNNCEGKEYKRMLMIMNAYNFLRDYIYSERAVNMGLISNESVRTDYVKVVGTLIEKLKVVVKTCSCD